MREWESLMSRRLCQCNESVNIPRSHIPHSQLTGDISFVARQCRVWSCIPPTLTGYSRKRNRDFPWSYSAENRQQRMFSHQHFPRTQRRAVFYGKRVGFLSLRLSSWLCRLDLGLDRFGQEPRIHSNPTLSLTMATCQVDSHESVAFCLFLPQLQLMFPKYGYYDVRSTTFASDM